MLEHLKSHLQGKVVILGIGNTLKSDDGIGSLLAARLQNKIPHIVYDAGSNPENYLGKIIKDKPDNIILIDAVDFGGKPGEFREIEPGQINEAHFFSTHDASLAIVINYLHSNLALDIIILAIQPKRLSLGDKLSLELTATLKELENWFYAADKK